MKVLCLVEELNISYANMLSMRRNLPDFILQPERLKTDAKDILCNDHQYHASIYRGQYTGDDCRPKRCGGRTRILFLGQ